MLNQGQLSKMQNSDKYMNSDVMSKRKGELNVASNEPKVVHPANSNNV